VTQVFYSRMSFPSHNQPGIERVQSARWHFAFGTVL